MAIVQAKVIKSISQNDHNFLSCSLHDWHVYFKPLRSYVMKYLKHVIEQKMRILIAEDDPHLGPSLKKGITLYEANQ